MELSVLMKNTKTLDIYVGGDVEKGDMGGIHTRILIETALNPDYKKLTIDLSGAKYINSRIVDLICQCQKETKADGKELEIKNAYGQPEDILKLFDIRYRNELPEF